jgi:hypothetical protein
MVNIALPPHAPSSLLFGSFYFLDVVTIAKLEASHHFVLPIVNKFHK